MSKPLRLRGLKSIILYNPVFPEIVEAFAASWIEIFVVPDGDAEIKSKPLRLRGLKSRERSYRDTE